jgi:hypothetical protein
MMPGFGGSDSMDWREFVEVLHERGFKGAFEMENEANNSKGTGNLGATVQGFRATVRVSWPPCSGRSAKKATPTTARHINRCPNPFPKTFPCARWTIWGSKQ